MKSALGSAFLIAALFAAPASLGASAAQATTSTDQNLDRRIEKRLNASRLKKFDIKVSVTNGVATLTGTVRSEAERRKATQLATIAGIARVENQLAVDLAPKKLEVRS
jgi:osmotically-inducible protein OsmY